MRLAGGRVLPIDVRFTATERCRHSVGGTVEAGTRGAHHLAQKPADQLVCVGHRPRPVHRRGVDDRRQLALQHAGLDRFGQRRCEQLTIGIGGDHPRPHQRERGGADALELVADTHRRLPVQIDPAATGRFTIRRAVMGRAQHRSHHHRRRHRRPPPTIGIKMRRSLRRTRSRHRAPPTAHRTSPWSPDDDAPSESQGANPAHQPDPTRPPFCRGTFDDGGRPTFCSLT